MFQFIKLGNALFVAVSFGDSGDSYAVKSASGLFFWLPDAMLCLDRFSRINLLRGEVLISDLGVFYL